MPSAGQDFSRLHQLLLELKKVQDQLARGPKQIKARKNRTATAEAELAAREAELKDLRAETDRKNLDLKSKESHLLELKRKLNGAASNREYEIISGQIDADLAAKAVLEDEVLEYLDRVDALQQDIEQCKLKIQESDQDAREYAAQFEAKADDLQKQEQKLQSQVQDAEKIVPTTIREQYRRLVEAYGPEAMAESSGGVCTNCFVQLTMESKVKLNSGKTMFCGSCGRLLYQADAWLER